MVDQGQGRAPPIWGPCPHRSQPGPLYGGQWLPEPGSSTGRKAIKSLHAATAHVPFEGLAALEPVAWPLPFASLAGAQASPGTSQPSRHVGREARTSRGSRRPHAKPGSPESRAPPHRKQLATLVSPGGQGACAGRQSPEGPPGAWVLAGTWGWSWGGGHKKGHQDKWSAPPPAGQVLRGWLVLGHPLLPKSVAAGWGWSNRDQPCTGKGATTGGSLGSRAAGL